MKKHHNSGFGIIEFLVIIIVILILGGIGYVWWMRHAPVVKNTSKVTQPSAPSPEAQTPAKPSVSAGWTFYDNKDLGVSFAYPDSWKNAPSVNGRCNGNAADFNASACPLFGTLDPTAYIEYQTKKYGSLVGSLVYYGLYQQSDQTLNNLYQELQSEYSSTDGYTSKPSRLLSVNGLHGFYVNQQTNSYSDNIYVIDMGGGTYLEFINRESDKHYSSTATGNQLDDQNDYTQYTDTLEQIVQTVHTF